MRRNRQEFGLSVAQFVSATGANGSTAFAQNAGRIPRMRALMSAVPAGMPRSAAAGAADGKA